jgi:hypothetical protein
MGSPAWGNAARAAIGMRIPGHADQRSGLMTITIPGAWRSGFRDDGDRCSGLMPISFRLRPEC